MPETTNTTVSRNEREAAEDIFYGQVVINWARWFVILAGTAFVMMAAESTSDLAIGMAPVVGLMVVNFYLHGRRLVNQPANLTLVGISSVIDVILITAVVIIGPSEEFRGLDSQFYVLYFPVIAAFSFVFGRKRAIVFTAATGTAYVAASIIAAQERSTQRCGARVPEKLARPRRQPLGSLAVAASRRRYHSPSPREAQR